MLKVLAFLALVAFTNAQVPSAGQCNPDLPVQKNFSIPQYLGVWYQIHRYDAVNEQVGGQRMECITATYSMGNGFVVVDNRGIYNNKQYQDIGNATVLDAASGEGKLEVLFPTSQNGKAPYWVLSTNYDSYSFVYSCRNNGTANKLTTSWILSRQPYLKPADAVAINNYIVNDTSNAVNWDTFKPTIQWGDTCRSSASTKSIAILMLFISAFFAKFF